MDNDTQPYRVHVSDRLHALGQSSRVLLRLVLWSAVVLCAVLGCTFLGVALTTWEDGDATWPLVVVAVCFLAAAALAGWFAIRGGRGATHLSAQGTVLTLTTTTIEFAEVPGHRAAESWPLAGIRTEVRPGRRGSITFLAPDREPRRLFQHGVDQPVEEVRERVARAQRALADGGQASPRS
ncbi:hypothetical protein [uncultured Tessaracoccus sp.]|uniref:hypothetical protein n=1 Tax=uncultured Tessaracoccus sp. TaxID=905023 RepID=UPI0025F57238|nr:hypothetical protein [uncultured Tessaracoccus sp.]